MSDTMEREGFIKGNITKKPEPGAPDYRKAWIANVNEYNENVKPHPFCHGIQMDTHHLISGKALNDLGQDIQDALIYKGYNVNALNNLVGLPKTYKGACYLGIQLHRTQHTFKSNEFGEVQTSNYHKEVIKFIHSIESEITQCNGTTAIEESKRDIHVNHMDQLSRKLLNKILNFQLPLTKIGHHFNKKSKVYIGCANKEKIGELSGSELQPCNQNHYGTLDSTKGYEPDTPIQFNDEWVPKVTI
ncbi:AHH domain-containing protein [Vibrio neptunius]|uniref:AHH domain-containing protein n=1 Tax=Vibrio neptunius TaxID=170651 RepID=UPI003314BE42